MNGTFLITLGAVWPHVRLPSRLTTGDMLDRTVWDLRNVIITTFAAVVGASSLSPITGVDHSATPWQESLVTIGFGTVGITMLVSSLLILWGVAPNRSRYDPLNSPISANCVILNAGGSKV